VDDVDPEVLMWLTSDELVTRRRALVREYDRVLRQPHRDAAVIGRIRQAIENVHEIQSLSD
jgi:hypothetical protein